MRDPSAKFAAQSRRCSPQWDTFGYVSPFIARRARHNSDYRISYYGDHYDYKQGLSYEAHDIGMTSTPTHTVLVCEPTHLSQQLRLPWPSLNTLIVSSPPMAPEVQRRLPDGDKDGGIKTLHFSPRQHASLPTATVDSQEAEDLNVRKKHSDHSACMSYEVASDDRMYSIDSHSGGVTSECDQLRAPSECSEASLEDICNALVERLYTARETLTSSPCRFTPSEEWATDGPSNTAELFRRHSPDTFSQLPTQQTSNEALTLSGTAIALVKDNVQTAESLDCIFRDRKLSESHGQEPKPFQPQTIACGTPGENTKERVHPTTTLDTSNLLCNSDDNLVDVCMAKHQPGETRSEEALLCGSTSEDVLSEVVFRNMGLSRTFSSQLKNNSVRSKCITTLARQDEETFETTKLDEATSVECNVDEKNVSMQANSNSHAPGPNFAIDEVTLSDNNTSCPVPPRMFPDEKACLADLEKKCFTEQQSFVAKAEDTFNCDSEVVVTHSIDNAHEHGVNFDTQGQGSAAETASTNDEASKSVDLLERAGAVIQVCKASSSKKLCAADFPEVTHVKSLENNSCRDAPLAAVLPPSNIGIDCFSNTENRSDAGTCLRSYSRSSSNQPDEVADLIDEQSVETLTIRRNSSINETGLPQCRTLKKQRASYSGTRAGAHRLMGNNRNTFLDDNAWSLRSTQREAVHLLSAVPTTARASFVVPRSPSVTDVRCLLEKVLKRFPVLTELPSHSFRTRGVELRYVLQGITNWGSKGAVMRAKVMALITVGLDGKPAVGQSLRRRRRRRTQRSETAASTQENRDKSLHALRDPQYHILQADTLLDSKRISTPKQSATSSNATASVASDGPLTRFKRLFKIGSRQEQTDTTTAISDFTKTASTVIQAPESTFIRQLDCPLEVAVKIVNVDTAHVSYTTEKDELSRVMSEAALLSQLDHPCIPTYYESFSIEPSFCVIVQEHLIGSVRRLYHDLGPLPEWVIAFITRDVVSALDYLHSKASAFSGASCIHRDIKAANILLDTSATAKLIDFGVSTVVPKGGVAFSFVGTPKWMAPEVANTYSEGAGTPADIWSLGLTIIEMATGMLPSALNEGTPEDVVARIAWDPSFEPTLQDGLYPLGFARKHALASTTVSLRTTTMRKSGTPPANNTAEKVSQPNFTGSSSQEDSQQHTMLRLEFSDDLKDFVKRCIRRNPLERATAEELLAHPFLSRGLRRPASYRDLFIELHKHASQQMKRAVVASRVDPVCEHHSLEKPSVRANEEVAVYLEQRSQEGMFNAAASPALSLCETTTLTPPRALEQATAPVEQSPSKDSRFSPSLKNPSTLREPASRPSFVERLDLLGRFWKKNVREESNRTIAEVQPSKFEACVLDLQANLDPAIASKLNNEFTDLDLQLHDVSSPCPHCGDAKHPSCTSPWDVLESRVKANDPL